MTDSTSGKTNIGQLILWPALITLGITILRLLGELRGWPHPWFNASAGGGGALIGISWLPVIFGPYFAWKLAAAGQGPASAGRAIGAALGGLVPIVLGAILSFPRSNHPAPLALFLVGSLIMLLGAFIPRWGWRALGNTMLAYAFAARIPVLIVMFIAMNRNGGQGWGTHYDVMPPFMVGVQMPVFEKWFMIGVMPQLTFWITWTVVVGSLLGSITTALFARRPAVQTAS